MKQVECWHCGKKGHMQIDCWAKQKDDGGKSKGQGDSAKGKDKGKSKGKTKGVHALEDAWPEPEVAENSTLDLYACSVCLGGVDSLWTKINLDTGAACTAWPTEFAPHVPAEEAKTGVRFKTATGEEVDADYIKKIEAVDERGRRRRLRGRVAPVHKPSASAASVCDAGADVYLCSDGGYIVSGPAK
jgi:hypothetical protein